MKQSEHRLQAAVATFLARALPPDAVFTSVDGAFKGDAIIGAMRKARGLKAGWPDMQFIWSGRFYSIELKTERGRLSESQERMRDAITLAGGHWAEARSIADVEFCLRIWAIPIRAATLTPGEIDARLAAKAEAPRKAARTRVTKPTSDRVARVNAVRSRIPF